MAKQGEIIDVTTGKTTGYFDEDLARLQQENTELKTRIARLSDMRHHVTPTVINGKAEYIHMSEISKYINKVLNETPQQSLNEIKADVKPSGE